MLLEQPGMACVLHKVVSVISRSSQLQAARNRQATLLSRVVLRRINTHIQKISEMDEACYKRNKQRGNRIANKVCRHALLLVLMWTRLLVSYGDADSFVAFQWDSSYMAEKLNQEFHAKDPIQHPFSLVSACCIRDIPCRSFIFESGEDLSNFRAQNAKPPRKHRSVGLGKQAEDMTSPSVNSLSLC